MTSLAFKTPMTSFSALDHGINHGADGEEQAQSSYQGSFHSFATSIPQRHRTLSSENIHPIRTNNTTVQYNDSFDHNDEDENLISSYYDVNRSKQELLLVFTNIFRFITIVSLALAVYFMV